MSDYAGFYSWQETGKNIFKDNKNKLFDRLKYVLGARIKIITCDGLNYDECSYILISLRFDVNSI